MNETLDAVFIQVGNTHTVLARFQATGLSSHRFLTPRSLLRGFCALVLADELLAGANTLYLGGVVPQVLEALTTCIAGSGFLPKPRLLEAGMAAERVDLQYEPATSLGFDRVCKLLAAQRLRPEQDSILVDLGTAITVDLLQDGRTFVGGLIMPGEQACLDALGQSAAQLSCLSVLDAPSPGQIGFGQNTRDCIYQGVRQMMLGGLDFALGQSISRLPNASILMTGGGALVYADVLSRHYPVLHLPDLVLQGMAMVAELMPE